MTDEPNRAMEITEEVLQALSGDLSGSISTTKLGIAQPIIAAALAERDAEIARLKDITRQLDGPILAEQADRIRQLEAGLEELEDKAALCGGNKYASIVRRVARALLNSKGA